jgi:hypothetical protein
MPDGPPASGAAEWTGVVELQRHWIPASAGMTTLAPSPSRFRGNDDFGGVPGPLPRE